MRQLKRQSIDIRGDKKSRSSRTAEHLQRGLKLDKGRKRSKRTQGWKQRKGGPGTDADTGGANIAQREDRGLKRKIEEKSAVGVKVKLRVGGEGGERKTRRGN